MRIQYFVDQESEAPPNQMSRIEDWSQANTKNT